MSASRFHELLSDLTVAFRSTGLYKRAAKAPAKDLHPKDGTPSGPQVIIYTRKAEKDFAITFMSDNLVTQLGYRPHEFINKPSLWLQRIHPDDAPKVQGVWDHLMRTRHHVLEYRLQHKDGSYRSIRDELNLMLDNDGVPYEILGTWIDTTESKRVEDALRRSESRYRSLVDSAPMGMVSFDTQGEITEYNPAALTILGAPFMGGAEAGDLFSLLPMVEAGISEAILHCLETGEAGVGEFQYKSKTDRDLYTRVHVVPIRDGDSRITGAHSFVLDISDQKRAEELIVRSERLKVLGQISNGVGHTFNNLLQIVAGNANMALTNLDLKDSAGVRANIEQILGSAHKVTEAVRWLQHFGRERPHGAVSPKEVFDFTDAVEEGVELCKLWSKSDLEKHNVHITYDLKLTRGCYVYGTPDQLAWMSLNLLKNAVESLHAGGIIKVQTNVKGDQVVLIVQDEGGGIPSQNIQYITQAFWTTKASHAGMGLTFNSEIIRKHGGSMGVKRIRPHGSIFMVRLPYIKDPSQMRKALAKEVSDKGFRILFVDDEEPVVRMFEKGLTLLGQTILPATSGKEALQIFEKERVDAIVCDLAMPEMNGRQVSAAIRRVADNKGIVKPPFIILSGHASPADEEETLAHPGIDRFLQKPITVPKLLEAISDEVQKATGHSSFSGRIEGIDLLEYLQLLILNGRKLVLEINPREGSKGMIFVTKGEICHAECGNVEGEEALYKCLTFKGGSFSSHAWRDPEKVTIKRPAQFLLIQAARRRDELRSKETEEYSPDDDTTPSHTDLFSEE